MKKVFAMTVCIALLLTLAACGKTQKDEVLGSLGEYSEICFYSDGGFQDFVDYGKYKIKAARLENNPYLKKLDPASLSVLTAHIDAYEQWVTESFLEKVPYDFDKSVIDESDYAYIYNDPDYPAYGCFNIYFYDSAAGVLYYFHANI